MLSLDVAMLCTRCVKQLRPSWGSSTISLCRDIFSVSKLRTVTSVQKRASMRPKSAKNFLQASSHRFHGSGVNGNANGGERLTALRSRTQEVVKNPDWSQMTVDYVMQDAGEDFMSVGKGVLSSLLDSHLKDSQLEMECLVLLLMASLNETNNTATTNETDVVAQENSNTDNFSIVPMESHLDFALLLILMRVGMDIHFRMKGATASGLEKSDDKDREPETIDVLDRLHVLVGDIMITSLFRKIAEMESPMVLKLVFQALSDTIERMVDQDSSNEDLQIYSHAPTGEDPTKFGVPDSKDGEHRHRVDSPIPVESESTGPGTARFPRNDLSACLEGILVTRPKDKPHLREAAKEFGRLLTHATHFQASHVGDSESLNAESYLEQALAHLNTFPDSHSRRYLAQVSRDMVRCKS